MAGESLEWKEQDGGRRGGGGGGGGGKGGGGWGLHKSQKLIYKN